MWRKVALTVVFQHTELGAEQQLVLPGNSEDEILTEAAVRVSIPPCALPDCPTYSSSRVVTINI